MYTVLNKLNTNTVESLIGIVSTTEENTHIDNRLGRQAKNEALRRNYATVMDYINEYLAPHKDGPNAKFFLEYSVAKQQRMHIVTAIDPQTNKVARNMMGSESWVTEISLNDTGLLDSFFLRVAEGISIKTERLDKLQQR